MSECKPLPTSATSASTSMRRLLNFFGEMFLPRFLTELSASPRLMRPGVEEEEEEEEEEESGSPAPPSDTAAARTTADPRYAGVTRRGWGLRSATLVADGRVRDEEVPMLHFK